MIPFSLITVIILSLAIVFLSGTQLEDGNRKFARALLVLGLTTTAVGLTLFGIWL